MFDGIVHDEHGMPRDPDRCKVIKDRREFLLKSAVKLLLTKVEEAGAMVPTKSLEDWPGIPEGDRGLESWVLRWEMAAFLL
eukprot:7823527-Alexandrium_andersonii.AAC.1